MLKELVAIREVHHLSHIVVTLHSALLVVKLGDVGMSVENGELGCGADFLVVAHRGIPISGDDVSSGAHELCDREIEKKMKSDSKCQKNVEV